MVMRMDSNKAINFLKILKENSERAETSFYSFLEMTQPNYKNFIQELYNALFKKIFTFEIQKLIQYFAQDESIKDYIGQYIYKYYLQSSFATTQFKVSFDKAPAGELTFQSKDVSLKINKDIFKGQKQELQQQLSSQYISKMADTKQYNMNGSIAIFLQMIWNRIQNFIDNTCGDLITIDSRNFVNIFLNGDPISAISEYLTNLNFNMSFANDYKFYGEMFITQFIKMKMDSAFKLSAIPLNMSIKNGGTLLDMVIQLLRKGAMYHGIFSFVKLLPISLEDMSNFKLYNKSIQIKDSTLKKYINNYSDFINTLINAKYTHDILSNGYDLGLMDRAANDILNSRKYLQSNIENFFNDYQNPKIFDELSIISGINFFIMNDQIIPLSHLLDYIIDSIQGEIISNRADQMAEKLFSITSEQIDNEKMSTNNKTTYTKSVNNTWILRESNVKNYYENLGNLYLNYEGIIIDLSKDIMKLLY